MASRFHTEALLRTASSARFTALKFAGHASITNIPVSLPQHLSLTLPASLTPQLITLGVNESAASLISAAMLRVAARWRDTVHADYLRRRLVIQTHLQSVHDVKFTASLVSAYTIIYSQGLQRWTSYILNVFTPRVLKARTLRSREEVAASPRHKKMFNQAAVPTLEAFFGTNAFPTKLEKCELANKCNMEYKQIHIWFQNRRSRSRKEGRPLNKRERPEFLRDLETVVVDALLLSPDDEGSSESIEDDLLSSERPNPASSWIAPTDAPPHAFPATYPPLCSYDPFPASSRVLPCEHLWPRVFHSQAPTHVQTGDIEELAALFSKLSIDGKSPIAVPSPCIPRRTSDLSSMACFGFATVCSPAPHPAFVRRPHRSSCSPRSAACLSSGSVSELQLCSPAPHRPRTMTRSLRDGSTSLDPRTCMTSISSSIMRHAKPGLPKRLPRYPFPRPSVNLDLNEDFRTHPKTSRRSSTSSVSSMSSSVDSTAPSTPVALSPMLVPCPSRGDSPHLTSFDADIDSALHSTYLDVGSSPTDIHLRNWVVDVVSHTNKPFMDGVLETFDSSAFFA